MLDDPPNLTKSVEKLCHLSLYLRWLLVCFCWLVVVPLALWQLREDIGLMRDYFTWSGLRYSLIYNLVPAFFLFTSVGLTLAVLLRHSQFILWGISTKDRAKLEQQVKNIYRIGPRHPLWKWLFY
ncbi:MAG: hypothetical protein AB4041_17675 [Microcystaceae cyanobacterium]